MTSASDPSMMPEFTSTSSGTNISTNATDTLKKITVAGVIVGVLAVMGAVIILLYYFTKYRHNRFEFCRKLKRRTWSSGSSYSQHNPLEPDDTGMSDPPPRTARQLFSITDNDDDGFAYDEIFETSEFTDEKTRKSIKHLYTATPTQDHVPDLNLRI